MSENLEITLGTKKYTLIKNGIEQAHQVADLSKWLAKHGMSIFDDLTSHAEKANAEKADAKNTDDKVANKDLFAAILNNVTADALVDLFSVLIGCTRRMSEKYFDIGILADAFMTVWDNQPAFKRLSERFFSTLDSSSPMEE